MSPLPVRVDTKARRDLSGEKTGCVSFPACETSSRACPPAPGTVQMSPPETNAISVPSAAIDGSASAGRAATGDCADGLTATIAENTAAAGTIEQIRIAVAYSPHAAAAAA